MIGDSYFLNDYNGLCSIAVGYSFYLTSLSIFREGFSRRKKIGEKTLMPFLVQIAREFIKS
jgi:hypothetical protein